jgi:hypothetical protein
MMTSCGVNTWIFCKWGKYLEKKKLKEFFNDNKTQTNFLSKAFWQFLNRHQQITF